MRGILFIGGLRRAFLLGVLGLLSLLQACSPSEEQHLKPEGTLTVRLPGIDERGGEKPDRLFRKDGVEFFFYFDPASDVLRPVPLGDTAAPIDPIPTDELSELAALNYFTPKCGYVSQDSIWVTIPQRDIIALLDQKGRLRWDRKLKRPDGRPHMFSATSREPFRRIGERFFIRSSITKVSYHEKPRTYFRIPPGLSFTVEDSSVSFSPFGGWPKKYRDTAKDYRENHPHRILFEKEGETMALYSYKASDSLYLYRGTELIRKEAAASRYIDSFEPFDTDSLGNMAYTKRYIMTSPKYGAIERDPYRELYYRQAFHPCSYRNPDGMTVKGPGDQPWSLIVLNEDFEKLGEIKMDPEKHWPGPLFVSEKGLLVPQKGEKTGTEEMRFTVFRPSEAL